MIISHICRCAAVLALLLTGGLTAASSASAHHTRLYLTLGVPARDDTPQNQRLYAAVGGVGNGNKLGDPIVLTTRAGLNPRQEWWIAWPTYPAYQGDVTGGHGVRLECVTGGCFDGRSEYETLRGKLVNRYSGKCLAVEGAGSVAPNNGVIQWTCEANARDQIWSYKAPSPVDLARTHISSVEPLANLNTCLGPQQRSAGVQVRMFGGPGICPHWLVHPGLRDHRYPQQFVNPF